MSNNQKVLIIGGSGKIGEFIIKELKEKCDISVFDVKEPKDNDLKFIRGDIRDLESLKENTKNIDTIMHLGAYPNEYAIPSYPQGWDVNFTGTFNVFEAAVTNKVKKIVYASSICATGILTWASSDHSIKYFPVNEEHPCNPQNLYGTSKLIAEKLAFMYARRSNTSFIGFRIASVWFKSEEGIDETTKLKLKSYIKDPSCVSTITCENKQRAINIKDLTWQFVDARDVAQAFYLALEKKDIKYGIYNIGSVETPSNWDSIKLAKYFYPDVRISNPLVFLVDKKRALWDISKAQKELGYNPLHNWQEYSE